jgi:hypothetical protein
MTGLTSCGVNWPKKKNLLNIYQPSTLSLEAGKAIETPEGVYTPQTDELWHSDKRFRLLEQEVIHQ